MEKELFYDTLQEAEQELNNLNGKEELFEEKRNAFFPLSKTIPPHKS